MSGWSKTPQTVLGRLRAEHVHALKHQSRIGVEWDRTLELVRGVDFEAIGSGPVVESIRAEVEIWHDLTLEPARRLFSYGQDLGLSKDGEEAYEYLHRVFVGREVGQYLVMCDAVEAELDAIVGSEGPVEASDLRDRLVELIELGVRASTRCVDWLEKRMAKIEAGD